MFDSLQSIAQEKFLLSGAIKVNALFKKRVSITVTVFIFHFKFRIAIKCSNCPSCFIWPITNRFLQSSTGTSKNVVQISGYNISRLLHICPGYYTKIHLVTSWFMVLCPSYWQDISQGQFHNCTLTALRTAL